MKAFESSNPSKEKTLSFSENEDEEDNEVSLINRYEIKDKKDLNNSLYISRIKKRSLPFMFYIFFFALLILNCSVVFYFIELFNKKQNYNFNLDPYDKPIISKYTYENITFDNGLQVLFIQVEKNNAAGGSIIFDTGYMDDKFKKGEVSMALSYLYNYNLESLKNLTEHFGNLKFSTDKFYSYFQFQILNADFFKFIKEFKNSLIFKKKSEDENRNKDYVKYIYNNLKNDIKNQEKISKNIENHLLEYLIYGFKDENNNDILLQYDETNSEMNINNIEEITKSFLNPSKIKIVLISRFKLSLARKKFLNYFKDIINMPKKNNDNESDYLSHDINNKNFTKNKVISYQISENKPNFIKIIYFIDKLINETNNEFMIKSGYFNYIKYILDETNKDSLYYNLTHSKEFNIKSLNCDFEVIFKTKIKFTINIHLNIKSYSHLDTIIYITYKYMYKITKHIEKMTLDDERYKEIYKILNQNFLFTEDSDDMLDISKKRGINLFNKNNKKYFLKDRWIPELINLEDIKKYFNQFKPENSIIILGINKYAKSSIKNDNNPYIHLNYTKLLNYEKKTKYYPISYSEDDFNLNLNSLKEGFNDDGEILQFYKNEYISDKLNKEIITENINATSPPKIIGNKTIIREFKFKNDTGFNIPKVSISLTLLHPFLRPIYNDNIEYYNENEKYNADKCYFELIVYISFVQRQINLTLSDALRAGNSIKVGTTASYFFINIFAYSDVAEKIILEISKIISNEKYKDDYIKQEFINNIEIYQQAALEDYLNLKGRNLDSKIKLVFYQSLNDKMYNKYLFIKENFISVNLDKEFENDYIMLNSFIIQGLIYGCYNLEQANKIVNLFSENVNSTQGRFINALDRANSLNVTSIENFTSWISYSSKIPIQNTKYIKDYLIKNEEDKNKLYRYIYWSEYKVEEDAYVKVLQKLFFSNKNINTKQLLHNGIYLYFCINKSIIFTENEYNQSKVTNYILNEIKKELEKKEKKYKEKIDSIGDRFYYLLKSILYSLYINREDMQTSSTYILNSGLHNSQIGDIDEIEKDFLNNKYEEIFKGIETKLKNNISYVDIFYEKNENDNNL